MFAAQRSRDPAGNHEKYLVLLFFKLSAKFKTETFKAVMISDDELL